MSLAEMEKPNIPASAARIAAFFLLTYAITWACRVPVVTGAIPAHTPLVSLLWIVGVFAPSLVSLALTAQEQGNAGVRALLNRAVQWDVRARWYAFAIVYMIAIKLAVALIHRLALGSWPRFGHERPLIMLVAIALSTPVQFGEEAGWRGYALPRLAGRIGFGGASLLLGLLWACWHIPQFFLASADTYRQSFPIWAVEVTAMSVAMAWLYTRERGSLLLMMVMHAAITNTKDIVPAAMAHPAGTFSLHASRVLYLTATCLALTAVYFLVRMPRRAEAFRQ
jgi:membrane protease YdiL (CAAX protease family)